MLARSSIEMAIQESQPHLIRAVGYGGLVAMCINAVVGSGVFLLPSETWRLLGPFSLWAPLLFALPVFVLALCFAEASSHFTAPGGAFLYARTAFGDFVGFETGWMNWLARVTSLAALANGFVVSLARIVPGAGEGAPRILLIVASLAFLGSVHALGIRQGAGMIYAFTTGKLIPLALFILAALLLFPSNPVPASFSLPGPQTDWSEAALLLLFAYAGFENLGVPAAEYKNPRRHLPWALLIGILLIAAIYALVQLGTMAALPDLPTTGTPVADAAGALLGRTGAIILSVGAVISILGTNAGTMFEGSRMLFALSLGRKRLRLVSRVHERFRTPWVAIAIHTSIAIPLAIGGTFAKLAVISTVARLTTYLVTAAAVPRLRRISEGFRTPGLVVPLLGVGIVLAIFFELRAIHLIGALLALGTGALLWLISGGRGEGVDEALSWSGE